MATIQRAGPRAHLLVGILPAFQHDALGFLEQCRSYGSVAWLQYGLLGDLLQKQWMSKGCVLNEPADIHHVLVTRHSNYVKSSITPAEAQAFGQGLLHSQEPLHFQRRQLLQPCFHPRHYEKYGWAIVQEASRIGEQLLDGMVVDIAQVMTQLTLRIIGRVLFSKDLSKDAPTLSQAITISQHQIANQYRSFAAFMTPLWVPTPAHRRFHHALGVINNWVAEEITKRRWANTNKEDVLSYLLQAQRQGQDGNPMSDNAIRDELVTLFLAGHETTANALTWLWYELAQHSEVEEMAITELQDVLQGRLPNTMDVQKLRYCKMILMEVLRMYPPAWMLHLRQALQSDVLPSETQVSARTEMWISPYSIHRDPRSFSHPNQFNPLRFQAFAREERSPSGFLPFGAGPRRCLGEGFAVLEAILVMATLRQRLKFRLLPNQTIAPDPLMTLRAKGQVLMQVTK